MCTVSLAIRAMHSLSGEHVVGIKEHFHLKIYMISEAPSDLTIMEQMELRLM